MELVAEAAAQHAGKGRALALRNVEAVTGLRFHSDRPLEIRVRVVQQDRCTMRCELRADFCSRDGKLVEADRCYLRGDVQFADDRLEAMPLRDSRGHHHWDAVQFPARGSKMYLGPPFQCLRKIHVAADFARGQIIAPALIELAGAHRSVEGWIIPSAALDACLYATGILCWTRVTPGATLPVRFGEIRFGRMPYPGEACMVETRFLRREDRFAVFDFTLFGGDSSPLVDVKEYYLAWLTS
jgi:hypothetical protein